MNTSNVVLKAAVMPEWRKIFEAEAGWQRQGIKAAVWKTVVTWNICDPNLVSVPEIVEHFALQDSTQKTVLGLLEEAGTG